MSHIKVSLIPVFASVLVFYIGICSSAVAAAFGPDPSQILGGDEGDACQMQVCLSDPMGKNLAECKDALEKYARLRDDQKESYLRKCPTVMGSGQK